MPLLGAVAHAEPILFTNPPPGEPGHADWEALELLDITRPSTDQPGLSNGFEIIGTFELFIREEFDVFNNTLTVNGVLDTGFGGRMNSGNVLIPSEPGDIIGPGGVIPTGGGGGVFFDTFTGGGALIKAERFAPLGESFIAVRFAGAHDGIEITNWKYGWIGFELFQLPNGGHDLYATRWAYETELDTAIAVIPTPGTAVVFLAASASFIARRRRRSAAPSCTGP